MHNVSRQEQMSVALSIHSLIVLIEISRLRVRAPIRNKTVSFLFLIIKLFIQFLIVLRNNTTIVCQLAEKAAFVLV